MSNPKYQFRDLTILVPGAALVVEYPCYLGVPPTHIDFPILESGGFRILCAHSYFEDGTYIMNHMRWFDTKPEQYLI